MKHRPKNHTFAIGTKPKEQMIEKNTKELPKIDLPQEWLVGTGISKELLALYTDFPCQIKSEIFVLCVGGEVEASINLNRIHVQPNDFVTIQPGSIIQIHRVEGDLELYIGGFSSKYMDQAQMDSSNLSSLYITLGHPVLSLSPEAAQIMKDYFKLLIRLQEYSGEHALKAFSPYLFNDVHAGILALYSKNVEENPHEQSRSESICKSFTQLVMQNYKTQRNVSWYAQKIGITHTHLCTTVKQATGSTCLEIISRMVIMDAKAQLKSTQLTIQEISDSLNFANMSFFGKYFKRYVGMSPLEYRNRG